MHACECTEDADVMQDSVEQSNMYHAGLVAGAVLADAQNQCSKFMTLNSLPNLECGGPFETVS